MCLIIFNLDIDGNMSGYVIIRFNNYKNIPITLLFLYIIILKTLFNLMKVRKSQTKVNIKSKESQTKVKIKKVTILIN